MYLEKSLKFQLDKHSSLFFQPPKTNFQKLFSLAMVVEQNKLECYSLAKSFQAILLALFENFRLAWKKLDGTNTLAYILKLF